MSNLLLLLIIFLSLFSNPSFACTTISPSNKPTLIQGLEQVRISLGQFDTTTQTWSFIISYAMYKNNTHANSDSKLQLPSVRVGNTNCKDIFTGTTTSYTYSVGPHLYDIGYVRNDFYESPWLYHVPISGIAPMQQIDYQVGLINAKKDSPNSSNEPNSLDLFRSQMFTAYAPPVPGQQPNNKQNKEQALLSIAVIGDIGQTEHSVRTRDSILASLNDVEQITPTIAVIVGDMSYADGGAERWDSWGRMMEPLASRLPIMVLPGNHEIELDNVTHQVFNHYRHRFIMPGLLQENSKPATDLDKWDNYGATFQYDGGSSFYSMDIGPIHIVCLNTYDTYSSKVQENFLENDLKKVDRATTPFVIAMMHAPWYNSNAGHQNEIATNKMRVWAEPLFVQYNVSAVFAGHVHAYERNYGMGVNGDIKKDGPMYVTIGDGGNHELFYDKWLEKPKYSMYHDSRYYGHGHLWAYNTSHLSWGWTPNGYNKHENGRYLNEIKEDIGVDTVWVHPYRLRPDLEADGMNGWGYFFVVLLILISIGFGYFVWKNSKHLKASAYSSTLPNDSLYQAPTDIDVDDDGLLLATLNQEKDRKSTFMAIDMSVPDEEEEVNESETKV